LIGFGETVLREAAGALASGVRIIPANDSGYLMPV
jgi:hypothetical protein